MNKRQTNSNATSPVNNYLTSPYLLPDYFTRQECETVIAASRDLTEYVGSAGEVKQSDDLRKSRLQFIAPDEETAWIFKKLENAAGLANQYYEFDIAGFRERLQVAEYSNSGHYTWHTDVGKDQTSSRKLSVSVQLTDGEDYEGGNLEFHSLGNLNASRGIGSTIIFPSYLLHRVTPVTSGTRRSLVVWVHGRPFR